MFFPLLFSSFLAGILMFLAPCTLPLVPGYLIFISGSSWEELENQKDASLVRRKIVLNGLLYTLGFSFVFLLFSLAFNVGGIVLGPYRPLLSRIGGVIITLFGLHMVGAFRHHWFDRFRAEKRLTPSKALVPGKPLSSFLFGATFALAWSPCIGPILGTVLLLSATRATVWSGILLLLVFCAGYAVPHLLVALGVGQASKLIKKYSRHLGKITFASGLAVIVLGLLLATGNLDAWTASAFRFTSLLPTDRLFEYF